MGLTRYLSLVIVVGHSNCGGAAACIAPAPDLPDSPLVRWLTPLANLAQSLGVGSLQPDEALSLLVKENVKQQVQNLTKMNTIKEAENVQVHGWVYDLPTGTLNDLGIEARFFLHLTSRSQL